MLAVEVVAVVLVRLVLAATGVVALVSLVALELHQILEQQIEAVVAVAVPMTQTVAAAVPVLLLFAIN